MEEVLRQLSASATLLSTLAGRPSVTKVSRTERLRLQALLVRARLTQAELAEASAAVKRSGFNAEDEVALLDCVADLAVGEEQEPLRRTHAVGHRTMLQNFETLHKFVPASVWGAVADGDMKGFVAYLVQLGLRNPAEPTSKVAALVFLLGNEGYEKAALHDSDARLSTIRIFKQMLRSQTKFALPPLEFVAVLPELPQALQRSHKLLYESLPEPPGACPFTDMQLEALKASTRMRSLRRGIPAQIVATHSEQPLAQMMAFGHAMLQQMSSMSHAIATLQRAGQPYQVDCKGPLDAAAHRLALAPPATPTTQARVADEASPDDLRSPRVLPTVGEMPSNERAGNPREAPAEPPRKQRKTVEEATQEILSALDAKQDLAHHGELLPKPKRATTKKMASAAPSEKARTTKPMKAEAKKKTAPTKPSGEGANAVVSHEKSRNQFLVRLPGAPSRTFRYDATSGSVATTHKKALSWARARCKELGIRCAV